MTRRECKENWCYVVAEEARKMEAANPTSVGAVVMPDRVIWVDTRKLDKPRIGVSKCNLDEDEFDLDTGLAIAYARAFNIEVPDYVIDDELEELRSLPIDGTFVLNGDNYAVVQKSYNAVRCFNLDTRKSCTFSGATKVKRTYLR